MAHRIVVIGGGFAGLYCARGLRRSPVEVTLIDRRNFHLFQPLLYQVATGGLSPANIAAPLRSAFAHQKNVRTLLAEVTGFDLTAKTVRLASGESVPFDTLVVAAGATHHYFGHSEWEEHAPGLKTIEDATEIRRRILTAFEEAERTTDLNLRAKLLTFVVVGGGPTGVEMAGAISELARVTMRRDFRSIDPAQAKVILIEGQTRVLGAFHEKLSAYALKALADLGVEVQLDAHVTEITADRVTITTDTTKISRTIETHNVVWAAGVKASPLGKMLAEGLNNTVTLGRAGHVSIQPDCTLTGRPDIFVIGDMASQPGTNGKPLPGVAPVAMQQGAYVADVIHRRLKGESPRGPFSYWDKGSMATIGRKRAVADTGWLKLTGFLAWMAWLFIHVLYLAQFSNRILVMFQWFWNYITRNRSARLITGDRR
ncbi:MAG: NAD(P)/FAD-dependent oxidoreductase [Fimbriiglobus sp.]